MEDKRRVSGTRITSEIKIFQVLREAKRNLVTHDATRISPASRLKFPQNGGLQPPSPASSSSSSSSSTLVCIRRDIALRRTLLIFFLIPRPPARDAKCRTARKWAPRYVDSISFYYKPEYYNRTRPWLHDNRFYRRLCLERALTRFVWTKSYASMLHTCLHTHIHKGPLISPSNKVISHIFRISLNFIYLVHQVSKFLVVLIRFVTVSQKYTLMSILLHHNNSD